jgi:protein-export membrane protein SecD
VEGFQWIRVSTIIALFAGALYVLLPTILQQDAEELLGEKAGSVKSTQTAPDLKLKYAVNGVDVDVALEAVKQRLSTSSGVERVQREDNQIVVVVQVGSEPETIAAAVEESYTMRMLALNGLLEADVSGSEAAELVVNPDVLAANLEDTTQDLSLELSVYSGFGDGTLSATPDVDPGPIAIVVDGALSGVATLNRDAEGQLTDSVTLATVLGGSSITKALGKPALPGELVRIEDDADADIATLAATDDAGEGKAELPAWLVGILPNTRMPLGLDLMGGIDLTLQVELEEALVAQAKRDSTYLVDQAQEKGLVFDAIDFDRFDPIIKVTTENSASEVAAFFSTALSGDYEYQDTVDGAHWFVMSAVRQEDVQEQGVKQVLDTVRRRVADIGVRDPVVVRKSGGKISVQLPGLTNLEGAVGSVSKTAVLEFRLVDEEFSPTDVRKLVAVAREKMPEAQFNLDKLVNEWLWQTGRLKKDRIILWEYDDTRNEETGEIVHARARPLPLQATVILTGADVNGADVGFDQSTQQANVSLNFKPKGSTVFCDVTGERIGKRFAIILDGEIKSAPNIRERICGGRAQITMGSSLNASADAKTLAVVLRTGSLDAPISIGEVRQVGPSLGQDAIREGGIATIIGGSVVLIFMVFWYRRAGLIANCALILNVMLMLAGLSLFGWTLTLPGIAGVALTVGMAVDANIIIYERIREELQMGELPRKAVETGFQKAVVAVLDANITTAIAGVVLFSYGNVTIQGFAVTLLIGIGTTLLTALFVTRSLLELVTRRSDARLRI